MITQDEKEKYASVCGSSIEFIDEVRKESGGSFSDVAFCIARFSRRTGSSNPERDMRKLKLHFQNYSECLSFCHQKFGRSGHLILPWINAQ